LICCVDDYDSALFVKWGISCIAMWEDMLIPGPPKIQGRPLPSVGLRHSKFLGVLTVMHENLDMEQIA
jgi:hypothetical protein